MSAKSTVITRGLPQVEREIRFVGRKIETANRMFGRLEISDRVHRNFMRDLRMKLLELRAEAERAEKFAELVRKASGAQVTASLKERLRNQDLEVR